MKYSAIILIAGLSTRLGFNKARLKFRNKNIIRLSVSIFLKDINCGEIILVVNKNDYKFFNLLFKFNKNIKIIIGGSNRDNSVLNGLNIANYDYVMIHDGARPFINSNLLKDLFTELSNNVSGVIPFINCVDSIYDQNTNSYIDRNNIKIIQTPQAFKKQDLVNSFNQFNNKEFTDQGQILLNANYKVKFIQGSYENIKITYKEHVDLIKKR